MSDRYILLLGTCDTKLEELLFIQDLIAGNGVQVKLIDVGQTPVEHQEVAFTHSHFSPPDHSALDRPDFIREMIPSVSAFVRKLYESKQISGVICIGRSSETSMGTSVMRNSLPIGFPKLAVSTVASGEVSNFVGETDITMMYSVVDTAVQNSILNSILENAAGMIAGAAKAYENRTQREPSSTREPRKKTVAITMLDNTTPAMDAAREVFEAHGLEVFVFHATGRGGRTMETLITEHRIDGVLDLTTSELADELLGATMGAGPDRLTAAATLNIPQVVSLGALDMVKFGPRPTLPATFGARNIYAHNPDITLVRTSVDECRILGTRIAEKLLRTAKPESIQVFFPLGGLSMLGAEGGPYNDKAADQALFDAIRDGLNGSGIRIIEDSRAINDGGFSVSMAEALINLL